MSGNSKDPKTRRITIRIQPRILDYYERLADRHGTSLGEALRIGLEEYKRQRR